MGRETESVFWGSTPCGSGLEYLWGRSPRLEGFLKCGRVWRETKEGWSFHHNMPDSGNMDARGQGSASTRTTE